jgi:hypothetical protein
MLAYGDAVIGPIALTSITVTQTMSFIRLAKD